MFEIALGPDLSSFDNEIAFRTYGGAIDKGGHVRLSPDLVMYIQ
jgi:hypothetical protein